jgi:hypothetical protein
LLGLICTLSHLTKGTLQELECYIDFIKDSKSYDILRQDTCFAGC